MNTTTTQASRLTSKNLFDSIFRDIPADVILDLGPQTVREEEMMAHLTEPPPPPPPSSSSYWDDELDVDALDAVNGEKVDTANHVAAVPLLTISSVAVMPIAQGEPHSSPANQTRMAELHTGRKGTQSPPPLQPRSEADVCATRLPHESVAAPLTMHLNATDAAVRVARRFAEELSGEEKETSQSEEEVNHGSRDADTRHTPSSLLKSSRPDSTAVHTLSASNVTGAATQSGAALTHAAGQRPELTAEQQIASMPPGKNDRLYEGACQMYRHNKGFGFISPDCGGPDIYFVRDDVSATFTRLVLTLYYRSNGLPIPASLLTWAQVLLLLQQQQLLPSSYAEYNDDAKDNENAEDAKPTNVRQTSAHDGTKDAAAPQALGHTAFSFMSTDTDKPHRCLSAAPTHNNTSSNNHNNNNNCGSNFTSPFVRVNGQSSLTVTATEYTWAMRAAKRLHGAAAHVVPLLQSFVDHGTAVVFPHDRVSFTTQLNRVDRSGGPNSRLLRAGHVRGVESQGYALSMEQSWFAPLFAHAEDEEEPPSRTGGGGADVNAAEAKHDLTSSSPHVLHTRHNNSNNNNNNNNSSNEQNDSQPIDLHKQSRPCKPMEAESALLIRYTGIVQACMEDDQRGYIRPDAAMEQGDVMFYYSAFLWSSEVPASQRAVLPRMRVVFSLIRPHPRNRRFLATLVTPPSGTPFDLTNIIIVSSGGAEEQTEARLGESGEAAAVWGEHGRRRTTTTMNSNMNINMHNNNWPDSRGYGVVSEGGVGRATGPSRLLGQDARTPPGYGASGGVPGERWAGVTGGLGASGKRGREAAAEETHDDDEVLLFEEDGYALV